MERTSCKTDFQSWKGIMALKLLCCNIIAGRFDWKKYCTPQPYCGQDICVIPLHCSYGQIGYTVYFPYADMPEVEYDWEMNKLTIDKREYNSNIASCPSLKNIHQWRASFKKQYVVMVERELEIKLY